MIVHRHNHIYACRQSGGCKQQKKEQRKPEAILVKYMKYTRATYTHNNWMVWKETSKRKEKKTCSSNRKKVEPTQLHTWTIQNVDKSHRKKAKKGCAFICVFYANKFNLSTNSIFIFTFTFTFTFTCARRIHFYVDAFVSSILRFILIFCIFVYFRKIEFEIEIEIEMKKIK